MKSWVRAGRGRCGRNGLWRGEKMGRSDLKSSRNCCQPLARLQGVARGLVSPPPLRQHPQRFLPVRIPPLKTSCCRLGGVGRDRVCPGHTGPALQGMPAPHRDRVDMRSRLSELCTTMRTAIVFIYSGCPDSTAGGGLKQQTLPLSPSPRLEVQDQAVSGVAPSAGRDGRLCPWLVGAHPLLRLSRGFPSACVSLWPSSPFIRGSPACKRPSRLGAGRTGVGTSA